MHVSRFAATAALGLVIAAPSTYAEAIEIEPIQVGAGLASSFVQIDFLDGPTYLFEVFHHNDNTTGMDLLYTLDAELGDQFVLDYQPFDFGNLISTLGYDGFSNTSDDELELWWWYWVRDSDQEPWAFSLESNTGRTVSDGSWDGWVFGSSDAPIEVKLIPAPPATLALAGLLIVGKRRRRAA